jgi:hypothetical protein
MAGYSATPLPRQLGVSGGDAVLLDGAPPGFVLAGPDGTAVPAHRRPGRGPYHVVLAFCPDAARLARRWPVLHPLTTPAGALWIAWPKRASGVATDLDENAVRVHGLEHGRVDVKVCAIDGTWSALKFVIRATERHLRA